MVLMFKGMVHKWVLNQAIAFTVRGLDSLTVIVLTFTVQEA